MRRCSTARAVCCATQGSIRYKEVWDVAMAHAAEVSNSSYMRGAETPIERAGGTNVDMLKEYHTLLCKVRYRRVKAHRTDKWEAQGGFAL